MEKIGIVTVLYNSESVLDDFFRTLEAQTYRNFVLYVIDNNSTDASLAKCIQLSDNVSFETKIFPEKTNWGVAKGNNIGIINALADSCDYVLLSNNDIVLEKDTIQNLYDGMKKMNASMAVPKIYFYGSNLIWAAGGYFSYFKGSTPHIGYMQIDHGQFDVSRTIDFAPTCFMLIRAEVFHKVGLMDEKFFVYFDDSDFVWRAVKCASLRLAYIPTSVLQHKESACTGGSRSDFSIFYFARNQRYFIRKNMKFPQKQLSLLYSSLHSLLIKSRRLSKGQYMILRQAIAASNKMDN
ncbi:MAG: glycosyltransferase family 2 protein [Bacteroidaceae bacterium]|nr:glycosyltransferase family 2 protein [Bacteroidaceae bacterium]